MDDSARLVVVVGVVMIVGSLITTFARTRKQKSGATRRFSLGSVGRRWFGGAKRDWRQALQEVSRDLGLRLFPNDEAYDCAMGEVCGLDVELEPNYDDDVVVAGVTVDVKNERELSIRRRGASSPRSRERASSAPVATGNPALDAAVEVRGASPKLAQALHADPELAASIMAAVAGLGAFVEEGEATLLGEFPETAAEARRRLDPLLDLARRLSDPFALHAAPTTGTAAAAELRTGYAAPEHDKLGACSAFLTRVGARLGPGQAFVDSDERKVEWQGQVRGWPLRFRVDVAFSIDVTVRTGVASRPLDLEYDSGKVQLVGAPPPWDERDSVRVFLARGVFFEGTQNDVADALRRFYRLPGALQGGLIEAMRRDRVRHFRIRDDIEIQFWPRLHQMVDPEGQVARVAELAAFIAEFQRASPAEPAGWVAAGNQLSAPLTCRYCSTLFLLDHHSACPNCGAAARAA